MKDCRDVALSIYSKMERGHFDPCEFINRNLSPPEIALVTLYLADLSQPFHLTTLLDKLIKAQKEHFVLDSRGSVVLVFDSRVEAMREMARLGKGYSVISGASK